MTVSAHCDDHDDDPDLLPRLLAGAGNCPKDVVALAEAVVTATEVPVVGDLATGAGLADRVTVLARIAVIIDAEVGRSVVAADSCDVLPHAPVTQLQRHAGWSGPAASAVVAAARFAHRHPTVADLWRSGQVNTDAVAAIARGLRGVTATVEERFVAAVVAQLPKLSVKGIKVLITQTLDHLHPHDRDAQDHTDWDRRCLTSTRHGGMTMISADLPGLEGQAVLAALDALADSLRVDGDRATKGQRRADALITLVNRAASHGDLPATRSGLPVATTVTIGITEADRIATSTPRPATTDIAATDIATAVRNGAQATTLTGGPGQPVTLGDAAARFILCTGDHRPVLVDDTSRTTHPISQTMTHTRLDPLAVGRAQRLATGAQRTALAVRDGGCILCHRPPAECQTHHVTPWSDGGRTDLDNLVLVCWAHHREVDLNRWTITRNPDTNPDQPHWLVTPTPRHQWRRRTPPVTSDNRETHSHARQ